MSVVRGTAPATNPSQMPTMKVPCYRRLRVVTHVCPGGSAPVLQLRTCIHCEQAHHGHDHGQGAKQPVVSCQPLDELKSPNPPFVHALAGLSLNSATLHPWIQPRCRQTVGRGHLHRRPLCPAVWQGYCSAQGAEPPTAISGVGSNLCFRMLTESRRCNTLRAPVPAFPGSLTHIAS